jgi:hypothetical protein
MSSSFFLRNSLYQKINMILNRQSAKVAKKGSFHIQKLGVLAANLFLLEPILKSFPLPSREGVRGGEVFLLYFLVILFTPTPTLPRQGGGSLILR